jgi:hypothetical protein
MTTCEWEECPEAATHTVTIAFPGVAEERWLVCRSHDRTLKVQALRNRPKAAQLLASGAGPTSVQWAECGRALNEPSNAALEMRQPCPECGSLLRGFGASLFEDVRLRESLRARLKRAGKSGWVLDTRGGDDYTRDLEAWGKRELTMDREHDVYREVIELYDGSRIVSTASLRDHQG